MPAPVRTIDVFPNPYSGIAPDGVPQGVVQMPGTRNYIGAFLDKAASDATGKNRFYYAEPNVEKKETGVHGMRKATVPFTPEIARAVLEGGLIVADVEHARMLGLSEKDYVDPAKQLEIERAKAAAELAARYGDAVKLAAVPTRPFERPAEEAKGTALVKDAPKKSRDVVLSESKDHSIAIRKPEEA